MIKVQQNQTITLYARWEKAPEEPEETDSFPALAAGFCWQGTTTPSATCARSTGSMTM